MDTNLIFQRTHAGRSEIHEKRQGLTQSERLVLIMIDGVSSYGDVRKKLLVLREERFARAFDTLISKGLIIEILLPVANQMPEDVERTVIDRFLQQDPLDPVTIIIHDIEEEFGEAMPPRHAATTETRAVLSTPCEVPLRTALSENKREALDTRVAQVVMDDHYIALADSLTKEFNERHVQDGRRTAKPVRELPKPVVTAGQKNAKLKTLTNWPYWSIGIGVAFIAGFVAAKIQS